MLEETNKNISKYVKSCSQNVNMVPREPELTGEFSEGFA